MASRATGQQPKQASNVAVLPSRRCSCPHTAGLSFLVTAAMMSIYLRTFQIQPVGGRGSQHEVAEPMGVDQADISGLEMGKRNPTVITLWHVANGLGASQRTSSSTRTAKPCRQKADLRRTCVSPHVNGSNAPSSRQDSRRWPSFNSIRRVAGTLALPAPCRSSPPRRRKGTVGLRNNIVVALGFINSGEYELDVGL